MDELKQLLTELQKERKNPLLFLGLQEEINYQAVLKLQNIIGSRGYDTLDVVLFTFGGQLDSSYQIAKLLLKKTKKLNIIIPYYAKSAGTLICLAADQIYLSDIAELGPIDTQVKEYQDGDSSKSISALDGFNALEQLRYQNIESVKIAAGMMINEGFDLKTSDLFTIANDFCEKTSAQMYSKLHPNMFGQHKRALDTAFRYAITILSNLKKNDYDRSKTIASKLVYSYPSHSYVLDYDELKYNVDLPVSQVEGRVQQLLNDLCLILCNFKGTNIQLFTSEIPSILEEAQAVIQSAETNINHPLNNS